MKPPSKQARVSLTGKARKKAFKKRHTVRCHYCGKGLNFGTATGDHKQPISGGGENKQRNIVMACHECNQRKGPTDYGTFMRLIREDGTYQAKRRTTQ
jgi:5-methylcytosine-specific restriction endonuclease McrA